MATPHIRRARWPLTASLGFLILCASLLPPAQGQGTLPRPRTLPPPANNAANDPAREKNGKAPAGPEIIPPSYPGGMYPGIPVTLPDVLNLAIMANLDIARANLAVEQARVALFQAGAQFLPNLSIGSTYVAHDGQIQNTAGNVQTVDRDSLFVGGGPSITLPLERALFGPLEARQLRDAALAGRARVTNETLLVIVDAYINVLRARRQLARLDEVLDFLTSEEFSELRGNAKSRSQGLLPLIRSFVKEGVPGGLPSDQARVEADVVRRQAERIRALEDLRVASAELSRLLHLNAGYFLIPAEDYRWSIPAPGKPWYDQPVEVLITQGLMSRPELAENQALLAAAITRYRATQWRPFVPTLSSGLSWGGFGGGPPIVNVRTTRVSTPGGGTANINTNVLGNSGIIANFGTRSDFDISLIWRLDNAGLGNLAQIRQAKLQTRQVELRQLQLQDLVVSDVVRTMERLQRAEQRVNVYSAGLFDEKKRPTGAIYRSIALNFLRIKGGQGLPLEVLDSLRRLSDVLEGYANALTDLDRARYRLLLVMGLPPAGLLDPACLPLPPRPPPPAATPGPVASQPVRLPAPTPVNDRGEAKKAATPLPPSPQPVAPAPAMRPLFYVAAPAQAPAAPAPLPAPQGPAPQGKPQGLLLPPIGQVPDSQPQNRIINHLPPARYPAPSGVE